MKARFFFTTVFSVLFMMIFRGLSGAQADYPTKPIQVLVGQPAGGNTDILARALAQDVKNYLGQDKVGLGKK